MKRTSESERFDHMAGYALMCSWVMIAVLLMGALVLDLLGVQA